MDDVTIAIKTFERPDSLKGLLASIRQFYPSVPILVADDSKEPYGPGMAREFSNMECVTLPFDSGISIGRNAMLKRIKTKYFVLCDDDLLFYEETRLETFKDILVQNDIELIGGVFMDKSESGKFDKPNPYAGHLIMDSDRNLRLDFIKMDRDVTRCDIVHNFFMADTQALLSKTGGWDPEFKVSEHTVFYWAAKKAGLKVAFTPGVRVNHTGARSTKYNYYRTRNNKYFLLFFKKLNLKSWTGAWGKVTPMDLRPKWYKFIFQQKCVPWFVTQKFSNLALRLKKASGR
jgi:GT2 family glycosyltransferase